MIHGEFYNCVLDLQLSVAQSTAEKKSAEMVAIMLADLHEATLSGSYANLASDMVDEFWETLQWCDTNIIPKFREMYACLVHMCPALHEPLLKAFEEKSPLKDLLPPLSSEAVPEIPLDPLIKPRFFKK